MIPAVSPAGRLLPALLLLLLCLPAPVVAGEQRLFWQAESAAGTLWLLGSLHFGTDTMYPLPEPIMAALSTADVLAVEVDISAVAPEAVATAISLRGLYHDDRRLSQLVDRPTWQALTASAQRLGLPSPLLERQKPWFAAMTLTTLALTRQGFHSDLGLDAHLIELAAGRDLPIIELESVERQIDLLDNLTEAGQLLMLEQTLQQIDAVDSGFQAMLDAWQAGDGERLARIIREEFAVDAGGRELFDVLVVERNRAMLHDITRLLQTHDVVFVVVGAGHMVGDEGILAGLATRGFRIRQPLLSAP